MRATLPELTPVIGAEPTYDDDGRERVRIVTCGACGRSWNDAAVSARTPTPAGRCPFEDEHPEPEPEQLAGYVRVPAELLARLMAAIETPDELADEERAELLEDADAIYPYQLEEED